MAGELLVKQGHQVVLHARDQARADDARRTLPQIQAVVLGDLASNKGTRSVAEHSRRQATEASYSHSMVPGGFEVTS